MAGEVLSNGGGKLGAVAPPSNNGGVSPSVLNSFRVSAVIERLSLHTRMHGATDSVEFFNLCLSLARGIDFAIANNEVPNRVEELPSLLKQICQWNKNETQLLGALMVLLISVKNACERGWFSDRDSEELRNLTAEIASNFCSVQNFNVKASCDLAVISTIMSRFYPRMRMGEMIVYLEAKTGFDAYVSDFQISKTLKFSPGESIRLFVAQKDSIETSSCIISPPKVNFLLNGKGVEKRTNVFMDTGPQIPTVVRHFLKYGSNLLQAVGEFNGNYIIAVALMSEVPNPDSSALKDYEQHGPAIVDSDSEIIEGPSRISLNCPISFKRIRTPVKGYLCKHIQCFDFDNFVDINSRRPSWRCPHCNQPVCFMDIRVDQKMVQILKEVGPKVTDIFVSSDGSWKADTKIDDDALDPEDKTPGFGEDDSQQPENVSSANAPTNILDLTQTDDFMDVIITHENVDRKLNPINQSTPPVEDPFWSGVYLSTFGMGSSNVLSDAQTVGTSCSTPAYVASSLPPSVTTTHHGGTQAFHGDALVSTSVSQNETSLPNTLQLKQSQLGNPASDGDVPITTSVSQREMSSPNTLQFNQCQIGNPAISSEYGRLSSIPGHLTRTPTAVQALPVQVPTPVPQQMSRNSANLNPTLQSSISMAPQASPVPPIITNSTVRPTPHRFPQQNVNLRATNVVPPAPRVSNEHQNPSRPWMNIRMTQPTSQSMQSPAGLLRPQNRARVSPEGVSNQQAQMVATTNRAIQMAIDPSRTPSTYSVNPDAHRIPSVGDQRVHTTGVTSQPLIRTDHSYDPGDQNWRPVARMRGALTGHAYSEALNQFIIRPTQQAQAQAQAPRPITNVTPHPALVPEKLQAFMGNRVARGTPQPNSTSAGPVNKPPAPNFTSAGPVNKPPAPNLTSAGPVTKPEMR